MSITAVSIAQEHLPKRGAIPFSIIVFPKLTEEAGKSDEDEKNFQNLLSLLFKLNTSSYISEESQICQPIFVLECQEIRNLLNIEFASQALGSYTKPISRFIERIFLQECIIISFDDSYVPLVKLLKGDTRLQQITQRLILINPSGSKSKSSFFYKQTKALFTKPVEILFNTSHIEDLAPHQQLDVIFPNNQKIEKPDQDEELIQFLRQALGWIERNDKSIKDDGSNDYSNIPTISRLQFIQEKKESEPIKQFIEITKDPFIYIQKVK
ncbi:MAG: hypothetical protein EZS28_014244 [Streblomastix strix]|uniref:Uncharacterized protein n=1 Tax=Streblomastix strix TaxID=222440 RepID=A0A5J4W5U9_9EUKA|nr:MAG: hypothetical protein EZS28_014244 [Streblomastix strix]